MIESKSFQHNPSHHLQPPRGRFTFSNLIPLSSRSLQPCCKSKNVNLSILQLSFSTARHISIPHIPSTRSAPINFLGTAHRSDHWIQRKPTATGALNERGIFHQRQRIIQHNQSVSQSISQWLQSESINHQLGLPLRLEHQRKCNGIDDPRWAMAGWKWKI